MKMQWHKGSEESTQLSEKALNCEDKAVRR